MLRFVLKRRQVNGNYERTTLETHDFWVPELEKLLLRGGVGPDGCDVTELVGVEMFGAEAPQ
jgi:hypothetical protein